MTRRDFSTLTAASLAGSTFGLVQSGARMRAAIIGHTGRGDYGHGMEMVFAHREDIEVVALADPDEAGRAAAAKRCGALKTYADYTEMLAKEKPQIVSIGPRWNDQHHAMTKAALMAGAHVYSEKPFVRAASESDELLKLAREKGLKIGVAHQMRSTPGILRLKEKLDENSLIGDLCEMHGVGKQDHRAGAEDMVVLACHLYGLMQFFAGDPLWCHAQIETKDGRPITLADKRGALKENIGPMAGERVFASYGFKNSVVGTFCSRAELKESTGPYGITLVGSKGSVRILANIQPRILVLTKNGLNHEWNDWKDDPSAHLLDATKGDQAHVGNRLTIDDLISAIKENRGPQSSGASAAIGNEMVQAAFASALAGQRLKLPLEERTHPFGE
ncbi:MAG: Gfo/Idh/MocA family oxidoreductase [Verrucomicrobiaceae bacterium]|nr:Gfo/Idh/MocA family oxidoreductase [Verrucomicrobiaceae bacterium]